MTIDSPKLDPYIVLIMYPENTNNNVPSGTANARIPKNDLRTNLLALSGEETNRFPSRGKRASPNNAPRVVIPKVIFDAAAKYPIWSGVENPFKKKNPLFM